MIVFASFCSPSLCGSAALNLGCVPMRASRSQGHTNPRTTYESPPRNLWSSHEWNDFNKEDPKDGILLDYNRDQLHELCQELL